ncbi:MAG: tetratricopeptide repeat protein [candidate division Zixibacteria bacterium]|jgi:tetratricopeptide (TPR) repeat protein|nr:tetratricopeptide repeat protein [candidate division Zixibacteria bacterium]
METYRLSSKLREKDSEYLIQTSNDSTVGAVSTSIFINGILAERTTQAHPEQVDPQDVLALVKSSHGEKKKEIESLLSAYRQAISQAEPDTMYHLGTAFYFKGFYAEARELFYQTAASGTEYHQAYNFLAVTELALNNAQEAVQNGARAVAMRPRFADYRNNYGEALLAVDDYKGAIEQFEQATEINMYYGDAYFNLAIAHIVEAVRQPDRERWGARLGRIGDCLKKAGLIYEIYRNPRTEQAVALLQRGELREALTALKAVREAKREAGRREYAAFHTRFLLVPGWMSEKVVADRIAFLKAELQKNPTYVDLYAELSQCYLEQSKMAWQKAIDNYRKTTEINPSLRRAQIALDETEAVYEKMCTALGRITEKG